MQKYYVCNSIFYSTNVYNSHIQNGPSANTLLET